MDKNYWQPNIDNWIINENDANNFNAQNFKFAGSDIMAKGVPVKSEEEENNEIEYPHKGISKYSDLCKHIEKELFQIYEISKCNKHSKKEGSVYDIILQKMRDPELIGMIDAASEEAKKRSISSF